MSEIIFSKLQPIDCTTFNEEKVRNHLRAFRQACHIQPMSKNDFNIVTNAEKTVLVVCPGPSHKEDVGNGKTRLEVILEENRDYKLILAGAGSGLLKNGTLSSDQVQGIVFNNPESDYELSLPSEEQLKDIPVYVATHCLPSVFNALQERQANIKPWNAYLTHMPDQFDNEILVGTGYGAAVASIGLLSAFGHRNFEVIGWDGSPFYTPDDDTLEAAKAREEQSQSVVVGGQEFIVHGPFANDVFEFANFVESYPKAITSIYVHGDLSYNGKLLNDGENPRTDFSKFQFRL